MKKCEMSLDTSPVQSEVTLVRRTECFHPIKKEKMVIGGTILRSGTCLFGVALCCEVCGKQLSPAKTILRVEK